MRLEPLPNGLDLLTSMITPAVLISACGTLVFSTSTRLARVVDRVRELSHSMEALFRGEVADFPAERREEMARQLAIYVRRSRLIQRSLTAYYVSLGLFVATTIAIGLTAFVPGMSFLPALLGIAGTPIPSSAACCSSGDAASQRRWTRRWSSSCGSLYEARQGFPERPRTILGPAAESFLGAGEGTGRLRLNARGFLERPTGWAWKTAERLTARARWKLGSNGPSTSGLLGTLEATATTS